MIELLELKNCIEAGQYARALAIIGEMEEMSREDKLNKIYSYMITYHSFNKNEVITISDNITIKLIG